MPRCNQEASYDKILSNIFAWITYSMYDCVVISISLSSHFLSAAEPRAPDLGTVNVVLVGGDYFDFRFFLESEFCMKQNL